MTIYMMSLDASGNLSAPSNGCVIGELAIPVQLAPRRAAALREVEGAYDHVLGGSRTGWDAIEASFTLHDGTSRRRVARRDDLVKWWEPAGSQALIVRQRAP